MEKRGEPKPFSTIVQQLGQNKKCINLIAGCVALCTLDLILTASIRRLCLAAEPTAASARSYILCLSFSHIIYFSRAWISLTARWTDKHSKERFSFYLVSHAQKKKAAGGARNVHASRKRSYLGARRHTPSTKTHSGTQDLLAVESLLLVFMGELLLGKERARVSRMKGNVIRNSSVVSSCICMICAVTQRDTCQIVASKVK